MAHPVFTERRQVTNGDVRQLVSRIREGIRHELRKAGKWVDTGGDPGDGVVGDEGELLPGLATAAV